MTRVPALHRQNLVRAALCIVAVSSLLASGCASQNVSQGETSDPLEPINRGLFAFNDVADKYVMRPIAVGYTWLLPAVVRTGINNFFDNISYPVDAINALLQGKVEQFASDSARIVINTTLGFGGFLDPATAAGLAKNNEDFGQTLGVWGIPDGPYLVVPFFGPRTFRSGFGDLVDIQYSPQFNLGRSGIRSKVNIVWLIHRRSTLLGVDQEIERAFDRYAFLRDSYLQNRQYLLYDGNPPEEDFFLDDEFDDE